MLCHITRCNIKAFVVLLLFLTSARLANAQTKPDQNKAKPDPAADAAYVAAELTRLKQYLDKDGGYKDKKGGYYNPKAGTYTDEKGGVVDNWKGYSYTDGSYKSALGDYWDAKTKTFKLSNGENVQSNDTTSEEARRLMRENVEANDGYDKYFCVKGMITAIRIEHPSTPANTQKRP